MLEDHCVSCLKKQPNGRIILIGTRQWYRFCSECADKKFYNPNVFRFQLLIEE